MSESPDQDVIEPIFPGSRWLPRRLPSRGAVRVMSVVEGWVVARYKGCQPFLEHQNDWPARYDIIRKE